MLRYANRYSARVVDTEGDAGREQPLVSKKEQGYRCLGVLCYYPTRTGGMCAWCTEYLSPVVLHTPIIITP